MPKTSVISWKIREAQCEKPHSEGTCEKKTSVRVVDHWTYITVWAGPFGLDSGTL